MKPNWEAVTRYPVFWGGEERRGGVEMTFVPTRREMWTACAHMCSHTHTYRHIRTLTGSMWRQRTLVHLLVFKFQEEEPAVCVSVLRTLPNHQQCLCICQTMGCCCRCCCTTSFTSEVVFVFVLLKFLIANCLYFVTHLTSSLQLYRWKF